MPTSREMQDLNDRCDWKWTTKNDVGGYEVRGKGAYASASIFLPCAGYGLGNSLYYAGSYSRYWSSASGSDNNISWGLYFNLSYHGTYYYYRYGGQSVRPVQGFTK